MCIFFHEWRITVASPAMYEDIFGSKINAYDIKQECVDCNKIRYKVVWECPGYRSEMIEIKMLKEKK
jgi:hypothetical protein